MKTDKLLHLIQQKRVMRSGGALPLPKAQIGKPQPIITLQRDQPVTVNKHFLTRMIKDPVIGIVNDPNVVKYNQILKDPVWSDSYQFLMNWYSDPVTKERLRKQRAPLNPMVEALNQKRFNSNLDWYFSQLEKNKKNAERVYPDFRDRDAYNALKNILDKRSEHEYEKNADLTTGFHIPRDSSVTITDSHRDKFLNDQTAVHELTHATPLDDFYKNYFKNFKSTKANQEERNYFEDNLNEIYPRIMDLRFQMNKDGILVPGMKVTPDMIEPYFNDSSMDIRNYYTPEELAKIMNEVAYNASSQESNQARQGGSLPIAQDGNKGEYLPVDPYLGLPVKNLKGVEVVGQKDYGSYLDQLSEDWANTYNENPVMSKVPGLNALLTAGNFLSTPQKSLMYALTGRYDTPSNINPTRGLGNFQNSAMDVMQDFVFDPLSFSGALPGLFNRGRNIFKGGKNLFNTGKNFKSEINWGKWNSEIPTNKALMDEYHAIEKTSKANGSWMKNPDGSTFQGTPEQFIQQNSSNFKKAFPEGFTTGYRGAHQHIDDFANRDLNAHTTTFLTDSKANAETYATSDGLSKTYYHPEVDVHPAYDPKLKGYPLNHEDGIYQLAFPKNLPKVVGEGRGNNWRFLDYDENIANNINPEHLKNDHEFRVLNLNSPRKNSSINLTYPNDFTIDKKYLTTDNYATYVKNNPIGIAEIKNVSDQMGSVPGISPNTIYAIDANKVPIKSLMYNNGMFDMTNPNIYKGLVPAGIFGAGMYEAQGMQQQKEGGSLPMHQWVTSQVLSQPGPTQAKANFANSSSLGMATQNAGNILNAIMSNKKNQPFVNFIDTRINDPVVPGKKLEATRKHHVKGVSRDELNRMVNQARKLKTDPATAITTALWETNMGQTDRNLVHDLYQVSPTEEGLEGFDAQANMAAQAINRQLKLGIKKYPKGPFYKQMQAFQGYGNLYPNTEEDYYGHTNQAFFGIPVTRQNPLRTNVLFPYGKTIENFRDSVVIPTLNQYGIKYKEKGGSLPKVETGPPSKWMRTGNTGFVNLKGATLDQKADAERKKKEKEEFLKKQREEDAKIYGTEAWKTDKTIEQLKDEENESLNNYYKTQQRGWELEDGAPFRETGIKLANGQYIPSDTELGFKTPEALAEGASNPFNWPGLALSAIGAWEAAAPILGAANTALSVPLSTVATLGNSAAMPWLTGNTLLGAYGASQIPGNLKRGEYGWAALNSLPFTGPLLGAGVRGTKNLYNTIAGESGLFSKFKGTPPVQATEYVVPEPVEFYKGIDIQKSIAKSRKPKPSREAEPLTDNLVLEKNPSRLQNVDEHIGTRRELKRVVDPSTDESISLKSWIDENGNVRYYFSSQMPSNSYNAGKSYYALDKFIPKNSTIVEPPGGSLSFDSFINTVKRTKNSKFKSSLLEGSGGIRLNNQSVKNKLPFSGDIGDGYYSSLDEAQKVADEINGFIKDYNLPKATVAQHPYDGSYQIMLPHISLEKLYKKGGELTSQKAAEMLQDGTANGKPLTDKQKRYFGYIANKK